jgi:PST family polysaccharide transporter
MRDGLRGIGEITGYLKGMIRPQSDQRDIVLNAAWLFGDKITRMVLGLFVGVWIARYLGPEQFGALQYAIAFVAIFAPLATLGLDGIVVRFLLQEPTERGELLGTAFLMRLCGGMIAVCVVFATVLIVRDGERSTHWLVGICALALIIQSVDIVDLWFQSQLQSRYSVVAKGCAFMSLSFVKIMLIIYNAPLVAFAWAVLAEAVIGAICLVLAYRKMRVNPLRWHGSSRRAKALLRDSWPLVLSGISVMIYMKIDLIMLGQMAGSSAVGIYSAASGMSEIWYFIPSVIVTSMFPMLLNDKSISASRYHEKLQHLFGVLVVIALAISVPTTFVATPLVVALFGQKFAAAGPVLAVHIWASVFVFLGVAQSAWDLAENLLRLSMMRTIAGALLNVGLNLVLIPQFAALGAAIATVLSYACSAYLFNAAHPLTRGVFQKQSRAIFFQNMRSAG